MYAAAKIACKAFLHRMSNVAVTKCFIESDMNKMSHLLASPYNVLSRSAASTEPDRDLAQEVREAGRAQAHRRAPGELRKRDRASRSLPRNLGVSDGG